MSLTKYVFAAISVLLCPAHAAHYRPIAKGLECLMVEQASILQRGLKPEGAIGMANVGHQITSGENFVLAIRGFESYGGPDGVLFVKATLEFGPPKQFLELGKPAIVKVIRSYYSDGSEGFVPELHRWALNPFQRFQLVRSRGLLIEVKVQGSIEVTDADGISKQTQKVAWSCPVKPRHVWQLDEWEGKVTNSVTFEPFKPNHGALIMQNYPPTK